MTRIEATVHGSKISAVLLDGPLTAGMVGAEAAFIFDATWEGLNIIAKFRAGNNVISRSLIANTETTVPHEVMRQAGYVLEVGAEGRTSDGCIVIPTIWVQVDTIRFSANSDSPEGREPTPTVYDDIMAAIEAGKVKGPKGDPGEKGDKGFTGEPGAPGKDGEDGYTPQKGVDYYTEADKNEVVTAVLAALPTWEGGSY